MAQHQPAASRVVPPVGTVTAAVGERNTGVRKIGRLTWQAGAVGLVFSGLLAGVLHNATVSATHPPASTGTQSGQGGGTLIPAQPPASSTGSGQVTSGAS
jgi:hypothetical protein